MSTCSLSNVNLKCCKNGEFVALFFFLVKTMKIVVQMTVYGSKIEDQTNVENVLRILVLKFDHVVAVISSLRISPYLLLMN